MSSVFMLPREHVVFVFLMKDSFLKKPYKGILKCQAARVLPTINKIGSDTEVSLDKVERM